MDNTRDLPGYKYYVAPDGTRPAVFVAFLDVAPAAGASVGGVCSPVDATLLAELDARERNYERRDVTALVADPAAAPGPTSAPRPGASASPPAGRPAPAWWPSST